ncbi:Hypothetical_protein [Hexamita inflata]|uniref:Hypothetical_protein n=1 Tax=Hexamita inflata TaxID=28002 RepID=A0ABP1HSY8_9EUKA
MQQGYIGCGSLNTTIESAALTSKGWYGYGQFINETFGAEYGNHSTASLETQIVRSRLIHISAYTNQLFTPLDACTVLQATLSVKALDLLITQVYQKLIIIRFCFSFHVQIIYSISLTIKMTPFMEVDILFYYKIYCFYKHESMTKVGFLLKFHFYTMQNLPILQSGQ